MLTGLKSTLPISSKDVPYLDFKRRVS